MPRKYKKRSYTGLSRLPKSIYNELSDEGKAKFVAKLKKAKSRSKKRASLNSMANQVANKVVAKLRTSKRRYYKKRR